MLVRMKFNVAGPRINALAGQLANVNDETAQEWIRDGWAVPGFVPAAPKVGVGPKKVHIAQERAEGEEPAKMLVSQ